MDKKKLRVNYKKRGGGAPKRDYSFQLEEKEAV
jgi:hypothetical protein